MADNGMTQDKPLIVISGSDGLIGLRVVKRLAQDYCVVGIDNNPTDDFPGDEEIFCDLTNDQQTAEAFDKIRQKHGQDIASMIHLAAYYDFSGEPSPLYDELTVNGTRRIFDQLQRFNVEQFLFSSSLLVMEPCSEGEVLTEESPTRAEWAYPESKLKVESLMEQNRGKWPMVSLRLAGVYDDECHSIPIGQQIKRIYEKDLESYFFPGNDDHGQSYIHLDDAVESIAALVENRQRLDENEVFLAGERDVVSYEEMQEIIGQACHGKEWPSIRIPKALAKAGAWVQNQMASDDEATFIKPWMIDMADAHYPVDHSHLTDKTGWQPQHSLRETLPEIVRVLKNDPQRWYELNGLPMPEELRS